MPNKAEIPESFFESRFEFTHPIIESWNNQIGTVGAILPALKSFGVSLADVTWEKDPKTFKDIAVYFNVLKLNAGLKIGLDWAVCTAANPDWADAPVLLSIFEQGMSALKKHLKVGVLTVDCSLAFHVQCKAADLFAKVSGFVRPELLGTGSSYGVSLYADNFNYVIDKSVRFDKALFIRIFRRFQGDISFEELAAALLKDETDILNKLDLTEF